MKGIKKQVGKNALLPTCFIFCVLFELILFCYLLQVTFFSYNPKDVALLENIRRSNLGEVFSTFFQADNHAVVLVADATLNQRFPTELTFAADDKLTKFHLSFLNLQVLRDEVIAEGVGEFLQLVVIADDLQLVAREDDGVAIRNVETLRATHDTTHVHTEALAKMQVLEGFATPSGIYGNLEVTDVDVTVQEMSLVEWLLLAIDLCHDVS